MTFKKTCVGVALGFGLLAASSECALASPVTVTFEGVAGTGQTSVGNNYTEAGYTFHNPGASSDAAIIPLSAYQNRSGSAYYTWNSPAANNPITLTQVGGGLFSLTQLDVGSKDDTASTFDIIGNLAGGGTIVDHVMNAANFSMLTLTGFDNLTSVNFKYISGDFGAIDNLHLNNSTVPEPASLALAGLALVGLGLASRRKSAATRA